MVTELKKASSSRVPQPGSPHCVEISLKSTDSSGVSGRQVGRVGSRWGEWAAGGASGRQVGRVGGRWGEWPAGGASGRQVGQVGSRWGDWAAGGTSAR